MGHKDHRVDHNLYVPKKKLQILLSKIVKQFLLIKCFQMWLQQTLAEVNAFE